MYLFEKWPKTASPTPHFWSSTFVWYFNAIVKYHFYVLRFFVSYRSAYYLTGSVRPNPVRKNVNRFVDHRAGCNSEWTFPSRVYFKSTTNVYCTLQVAIISNPVLQIRLECQNNYIWSKITIYHFLSSSKLINYYKTVWLRFQILSWLYISFFTLNWIDRPTSLKKVYRPFNFQKTAAAANN